MVAERQTAVCAVRAFVFSNPCFRPTISSKRFCRGMTMGVFFLWVWSQLGNHAFHDDHEAVSVFVVLASVHRVFCRYTLQRHRGRRLFGRGKWRDERATDAQISSVPSRKQPKFTRTHSSSQRAVPASRSPAGQGTYWPPQGKRGREMLQGQGRCIQRERLQRTRKEPF